MRLFHCVLFLLLITAGTLHGQDSPGRATTEAEARLHFFDKNAAALTGDRNPGLLLPDMGTSGRKSPALASLFSLILPGMGELYADGFSSGKYFLIADGVLWLTYASFQVYGDALRDDARAFSIARAGVRPDGKDDQYFVDIGNFLDIDQYNEKKLRDREPDRLYDRALGYAWRWDSDADRQAYREQRIAAENMFNNRKFVIAALIVNRVASAINATRAAIAHNNALDQAFGNLEFSAAVMGGLDHPHGILLSLKKGF